MTNEQIKQFYREIGDVMNKHKVSGIAGVWFAGEGHDEFGQLVFWDAANGQMKRVVELINKKYEGWARDVVGKELPVIGMVRESRSSAGDSEKN